MRKSSRSRPIPRQHRSRAGLRSAPRDAQFAANSAPSDVPNACKIAANDPAGTKVRAGVGLTPPTDELERPRPLGQRRRRSRHRPVSRPCRRSRLLAEHGHGERRSRQDIGCSVMRRSSTAVHAQPADKLAPPSVLWGSCGEVRSGARRAAQSVKQRPIGKTLANPAVRCAGSSSASTLRRSSDLFIRAAACGEPSTASGSHVWGSCGEVPTRKPRTEAAFRPTHALPKTAQGRVSGEGGIRTLDGRNRPYRFSRPAHSTALPPLRLASQVSATRRAKAPGAASSRPPTPAAARRTPAADRPTLRQAARPPPGGDG